MSGGWETGGVLAQNAPPKAETDCGVTAMCASPTPPAAHHGTPMWTAELLMFVVVLAALAAAYRLLLGRKG